MKFSWRLEDGPPGSLTAVSKNVFLMSFDIFTNLFHDLLPPTNHKDPISILWACPAASHTAEGPRK